MLKLLENAEAQVGSLREDVRTPAHRRFIAALAPSTELAAGHALGRSACGAERPTRLTLDPAKRRSFRRFLGFPLASG